MIKTRKHTQENINIFNNLLKAHNFQNINNIEDPDEAYDKFLHDFGELYNIAFPVITVKLTRKNTKREPWMTTGLLNSSNTKNKLMLKKIKNPTEQNIYKYKCYIKIYNKTLRYAKKTYYEQIFRENSSNSKRTWKILNETIKKHNPSPDFSSKFMINGAEIEDPNTIAQEFNKYFANIGKQVNNSVPHTHKHYTDFLTGQNNNNFFLHPVTPDELITFASKMKPKTSSGFDGIQMKLIKTVIEFIKVPLCHIFNQSFVKGTVPRQMKKAKIVPIYKSGKKNLFNNYRPISLLPAFSKLLEKLVCSRLMYFLDKYKLLYNHQYGFRKYHSTIHPIIHLLNHISENNDKATKDKTIGVFLDLSKAFDTIPHTALIRKLEYYGIRGIANNWFRSYLTDRKQFMEFKSCKSEDQSIECGVPQGSILGPILFIIFINDLHKASSLNIISFADDTTVYTSGNNINETIRTTNIELEKIFEWFCANKMQLNTNKSKFSIFGPMQTRLPNVLNDICINNQIITRTGNNCQEKAVKFLGVYLDENLTWNTHVDYISKKISQSLFAIHRVKDILPQIALKSLYYALIHSHLTYAVTLWGNSNQVYKLITKQKRAIRAISNAPYLSHTEPLFKQNRILQLHDLYNLQTTIFMYELHHNLLPSSFKKPEIKKSSYLIVTRQANKIKQERPRTTFSSKLPKHRFAKIWNDCEENVKTAVSKYAAKNKLKKYLIDNYKNDIKCSNPTCRYCI